jgi:TonB family protein
VKKRNQRQWWLFLPFVLISGAMHGFVLVIAGLLFPLIVPKVPPKPDIIQLVSLPPDKLKVKTPTEEEDLLPPEPEPEPEPPMPEDGQIVEIAPPENPVRPEEAQYLSEYDSTVKEETRSERYKVNPEVLSRVYSEEDKIEVKAEDVEDLDVTEPSTGATVGNHRFDPDKDGVLAALPSKWTKTNKPGEEDPVPASTQQSTFAGAPSNDRLDEKKGAETNVNSIAYPYAAYINRLRRLVQFYWVQNLHNLPSGVRLSKPEYTTSVNIVLDSSGALQSIDVTSESGSPELDDCLVRAFRVAGPFSNPPKGMIQKDGTVPIPGMSFTVELGMAQTRYDGIDPRAGVQFPGILKAPR